MYGANVFSMSIGQRVKALRVAKGMNQSQLARAVGVKASSINDIESGVTKSIKGTTLLGLTRVLECSSDWLQTGKGIPAAPAQLKTLEESELIAIFKAMSDGNKQALLAAARALLSAQPSEPTKANPFPRVKQ